VVIAAAEFHAPAGESYPSSGGSGATLPGGRTLRPWGKQLETGPGTAALALSPKGLAATADTGPERFGVTVLEPPAKGVWRVHHLWARTPNSSVPEKAEPAWKSVGAGLAFESEHLLWVSEGASGRIRLIDPQSGDRRKLVQLPSPATFTSQRADDFTGPRAPGQKTPVGSGPGNSGALALDPARHLLYALDTANPRLVVIDTRTARIFNTLALDSAPAAIALGEDSQTAWITCAAPSDAIIPIDLRDPVHPVVLVAQHADSQPGGIFAANGQIFVAEPKIDEILVISAVTRAISARIPLRIPRLDGFRGIAPAGMAFDPLTKWLLVAETGINAVGVIDFPTFNVIGHIPAGWMPVSVALAGGRVFIANHRGHGSGPNLRVPLLEFGEPPSVHHGSVTSFIMPPASELAALTATVLASNGFTPDALPAPPMPAAPQHVVLITTEGRSFDEVFGDVISVGKTPVASANPLSRFGLHGIAAGASGQFSLHDARVTPNLHGIAQNGAFSDNYYSEAEPPATEDVPSLLAHLVSHGMTVGRFDSAERFLDSFTGFLPIPAFIAIDLPRPTALSGRFPWEASFVADADLNIGRILEALSHSPSWNDTVVFIAASSASASLDHIDSHRTLLLAAGPSVRRTHLSQTNASFPSVVRAVLELLHVPPMGLRDATATSLREMFLDPAARRNPATFTAIDPDPRLFSAP